MPALPRPAASTGPPRIDRRGAGRGGAKLAHT